MYKTPVNPSKTTTKQQKTKPVETNKMKEPQQQQTNRNRNKTKLYNNNKTIKIKKISKKWWFGVGLKSQLLLNHIKANPPVSTILTWVIRRANVKEPTEAPNNAQQSYEMSHSNLGSATLWQLAFPEDRGT